MPRGKRKVVTPELPISESTTLVDEIVAERKRNEEDITTWPLKTMRDYIKYNEKARELNKKLKIERYELIPCPKELHPHEKVILNWVDGRSGDIPIDRSNHMIDFHEKITPGQPVSLPRYIVNYIQGKSTAQYDRVTLPDGTEDTREVGRIPRISVRTIYEEDSL